jgi:uncharacterized protein YjbI with pentapeptide repeats
MEEQKAQSQAVEEEKNVASYLLMAESGGSAEKPPAPAWLFDNITELSKSSRSLYTLYVGFLIYCALTLFSTSDRKIILDEQAHLPIANLDVSFSAFVPIASLIAIFFFIYFQLHLQALGREVNNLHSKYKIEQGRLHPWMITFAMETKAKPIEETKAGPIETGPLGWLQTIIIKFSLWLLLPTVLLLFTIWAFKKHDLKLSIGELSISIIGTICALWLWCRYESLGDPDKVSGWSVARWKKHKDAHLVKDAILSVALMVNLMFCGFLFIVHTGPFYPGAFFTDLLCVNLKNQSLINEQKQVYGGYLVDLHATHLEGANLYATILKHGYLESAQLSWALLSLANLETADLTNANLQYATIIEANLKDATLSLANLEGADLTEADLSGANLSYAVLLEANLKDTKFTGADLMNANLTGARDLTAEQLSDVKTLYGAQLDDPLRQQLMQTNPDLFKKPEPDRKPSP